MKATDIFFDWLIETDLFEMAFKRKVVINKIRDYQFQIAKHIIKHLYYDVVDDTKKHWEAELNTWLSSIDNYRLKGNKVLDSAIYYKLLFTEPLGELVDIQRTIRKIDNEYPELVKYKRQLSTEKLKQNIDDILKNISNDLSNESLLGFKYYIK